MTQVITGSPWLTMSEAAAHVKRGRRLLAREVKAGRLRAARVGGRGDLMFKAEWLDAWMENLVVIVDTRRGRGSQA